MSWPGLAYLSPRTVLTNWEAQTAEMHGLRVLAVRSLRAGVWLLPSGCAEGESVPCHPLTSAGSLAVFGTPRLVGVWLQSSHSVLYVLYLPPNCPPFYEDTSHIGLRAHPIPLGPHVN